MTNDIDLSQPTGKLTLKGKYMTPIVDFVSSLNFDRPVDWLFSLHETKIFEMISKLHSDYLDSSDVLAFLVNESMPFMVGHERKSGSLSDVRNEIYFEAFVNALKAAIESLPRIYTVCIEAPEFPASLPNRIQISDGIFLVTGTVMPSPRPRGPKEGIFQAHQERICYWEFRVAGYAKGDAQSVGVSDCLSKLKILAFNLVDSGIFFRCARAMPLTASITSELTGETTVFPLPQAIRRCFGNIAVRQEKVFMYEDVDPSQLDQTTAIDWGTAGSQQRQKMVLTKSLMPVAQFFAANSKPDFSSLCAAIEWYEDSLSAENQTFSYLAACIGLEAILGSDENITGLSNRLADRFAFMLGRGRAQRKELAEQYIAVLKVRGKLVHAKAARLASEELTQLTTARNMLQRVIKHEIGETMKNSIKS